MIRTIATPITEYAKAFSTNATNTSFASLAPTTTEPTGEGIIDQDWTGGKSYNTLLVLPFGSGSADNTMKLRVAGWRRISTLWIPTPIVEVLCTLGTATGVSGQSVVATDLFADTITLTNGPDSTVVRSPADNRIGWFMIDAMGFEKLQFLIDRNSSASSGNALYARL